MGWEIKTLQKAKETLKNDVDKLEKEIGSLESQKKSVLKKYKYFYQIHWLIFARLKMQMQ